MGSKVVLAPRNGAEAVALGVSACFLAVAAFVVQSDAVPVVSDPSSSVVAAASSTTPERRRTFSQPPTSSQVFGARILDIPPPLVMLPLDQQAQAKLDAAGTKRGEGATLVTVGRGQGVLALGGGVVGVTAAPPAQFPTAPTAPTTVVAAPTVAASTPAASTPATTPSTPPATPDPTPSTPPATPDPTPSTPPTDGGPGGTGDAGGDGSGAGSGTDSSGTQAGTDSGTQSDSAGTIAPGADPAPLGGASSAPQD